MLLLGTAASCPLDNSSVAFKQVQDIQRWGRGLEIGLRLFFFWRGLCVFFLRKRECDKIK